jgi:hypothetical protein
LSSEEAIGRLARVCDRWIYSSCLCFALSEEEQRASRFRYSLSVYQVEYSRNLLFRSGAQLDEVFDRIVDRTRARLDVPTLRTLFGFKRRPHRDRKAGPPRIEAVVETPVYDLTVFKLHFGKLTLKAYTKGEHVLRFEAIVHNTAELRTGRAIERFADIVDKLAGMLERFVTTCDCVHAGFVSNDTLDQLGERRRLGASIVGGIDPNKPRQRAVLKAVLALAAAPAGFSVGDLARKVQAITANPGYTVRQASYDLRKVRAHDLARRAGNTRRYLVPPDAARTIAAITTLRDDILLPLLAGLATSERRTRPRTYTKTDQHYDKLRTEMRGLLHDLGIAA